MVHLGVYFCRCQRAREKSLPTTEIARLTGLTTGASDFIESAQREGRYFIHQPYELYLEENHAAWRALYAGMAPRWERHANGPFLRGLDALQLDPCHVPRLTEVNSFALWPTAEPPRCGDKIRTCQIPCLSLLSWSSAREAVSRRPRHTARGFSPLALMAQVQRQAPWSGGFLALTNRPPSATMPAWNLDSPAKSPLSRPPPKD